MPNKKPISFDNGVVDEGTTNPTMTPATDVEVKPLDQDGNPIPGASVTLECGDPSRSYSGNEHPAHEHPGTYIFEDAIPQTGQEDCTMTVEAPG